MSRMFVEIEVDEERCKQVMGAEASVMEYVGQEFGWIAESGIYLKRVLLTIPKGMEQMMSCAGGAAR